MTADAWAFGPVGAPRSRRTLRPVGTAAGVLVALGVAVALGFTAFVMFAGREDPARPLIPPQPATDAVPAAAAQPVPALSVTDVMLTDSIDPATGEPSARIDRVSLGQQVQLWLSFEGDTQATRLTAVWFRDDHRIAKLTAPLPDAATQMVFPLPQVAVDAPGSYRVEVRSNRDVVAAETFEVTDD